MNPEVSIVMSCYNSERTLASAVESILNQTFANFEFIIIDDGSIDGTKEMLRSFEQQDNRILFIENDENIGLAASLNKGIVSASASLIARMDSDDISLPTRLEKQVEFMRKHPNVDILGTSVINKKQSNGELCGESIMPEKHEDIIKRIFKTTMILHPTIMLKKEVFELYGYYDPDRPLGGEDADLWYRIYDKVGWANLSEPLLIYTVKNKITRRIITTNLKTKYINLKRRNLLFNKGHLLLQDVVFYTIASITQMFRK